MSLALMTLNAPLLSNRKFWDNALQQQSERNDKNKQINRIRCSKRQYKQDVSYVLDLLYPPEDSTSTNLLQTQEQQDEITNLIPDTPFDEVEDDFVTAAQDDNTYFDELDIETDDTVSHSKVNDDQEPYLADEIDEDYDCTLEDYEGSDDETTICSNVSKPRMKKFHEDVHPQNPSSKGHSTKDYTYDVDPVDIQQHKEERDPLEEGLVLLPVVPDNKADSNNQSMNITVYTASMELDNKSTSDDLNSKLEQLENMWTNALIANNNSNSNKDTAQHVCHERDLESIQEEEDDNESIMGISRATRISEQETIDEDDEEEEEGSICSQMETSSYEDDDEEGSICSQASLHADDGEEGSICSQASSQEVEEEEEGSTCSQAEISSHHDEQENSPHKDDMSISVNGDLSFGPEDDPSSVMCDDRRNSITIGSSAGLSGSSWSDEYEQVLLNGIPKDLAISKKIFRDVPASVAVSDCSSSGNDDSHSEASYPKEAQHLQRYTSRADCPEIRQLPSSAEASRQCPSDEDSVSVSLSVVSVSSGSFSSSCYSIELMDLKARKMAIQRRFQSIGVPLSVSLSSKGSNSKGSGSKIGNNLVADFSGNRKWNEQYRKNFKETPMAISNRQVFANGIPMDVNIEEASVSSISWHQSGDDADSVSSASMSSVRSRPGSASSVSSSSVSSVQSNHSSGIMDLKARKREIERRVQSIEMLLGRSKSSPCG